MSDTFRDNAGEGRFELDVGGLLATADYRREGATLVIDWVEAAPPLRGTGAAGRLMGEILAVAQREGLTIVPRCGYAAAWLRRHG